MNLEKTEVRAAAEGRWIDLFKGLAPELEPALARLGRHVPCPVHGGKDGFRLFRDASATGGGVCNTCGPRPDGFALLGWLRGWRFPETLERVAEALGLSETVTRRDAASLKQAIAAAWLNALPCDHVRAAPVVRYFRRLGMNPAEVLKDTRDVRCHPALPYAEGGRILGRHPALLALVREASGRPLTVERIYLAEDGRLAPVASPRKRMPHPGRLAGAAVRLGRPGPFFGVAAGLENAFAVRAATGMAVWAYPVPALLPEAATPAGVDAVWIWTDRTEAGREAAMRLRERLAAAGLKGLVVGPPGPIGCGEWLEWQDAWAAIQEMAFPIRKARVA